MHRETHQLACEHSGIRNGDAAAHTALLLLDLNDLLLLRRVELHPVAGLELFREDRIAGGITPRPNARVQGCSPFGRFFPDQMTPGSQSGGMSSTAWTLGSRRRMWGPNDVAEEERVDRVDEMRMSEIAAQRVPDFFATDACERERGETGVPLCPAREFRADDLGDHPRLSTPGGRANESNACRILDDRALVRRGRSHAAVLARVVRPPGTRTL